MERATSQGQNHGGREGQSKGQSEEQEPLVPHQPRVESFRDKVVVRASAATMKMPKSPLGLGNERFFRELIESNFCGVVGARKLACRDRGSNREGNSG